MEVENIATEEEGEGVSMTELLAARNAKLEARVAELEATIEDGKVSIKSLRQTLETTNEKLRSVIDFASTAAEKTPQFGEFYNPALKIKERAVQAREILELVS